MANNLTKISLLDLISPTAMTSADLLYLVHSVGGVPTSYALQFSDIFVATNNLTSNIRFNNNSLFIKSGKVGINKEPTTALDVFGNATVSATVTAGSLSVQNTASVAYSLGVGTSASIGTTLTIGTSATIASRTVDAFPSGTKMLFVQSSAPTGWTKLTSNDDAALRVVSGSVTTGGSSGFTTAFSASRTLTGSVGNTAITIAQMPSHTHTATETAHTHTFPGDDQLSGWATIVSDINYSSDSTLQVGGHIYKTGSANSNITVASAGSDAEHNHSLSLDSLNLNVKYVDAIICQKN